MDRSDGEIVTRVLDGDVEAFRGLVVRHEPACSRYARRVLDHPADAEDVVQETFLRAYAALASYEDRGRFRAWLFRILVNQCRTLGRRRARWSPRLVPLDSAPAAALSAGPAIPAVELDEVERALARLIPERREAFLLKHVEELTYEEMAAVLDAGVSALKMRVRRAREDLRRHLGVAP